MTETQKTAREYFKYYSGYRVDGGSHASFMSSNNLDPLGDVSALLDEMHVRRAGGDVTEFYRAYPFMAHQTKKTVSRKHFKGIATQYEADMQELFRLVRIIEKDFKRKKNATKKITKKQPR